MATAKANNRVVSIIERTKNGGLKVSDRETIKCDDEHSGLDGVVKKLVKVGAEMVLILGEDDSVLRHWTRPAEKPTEAPPIAPAATDAKTYKGPTE